MEIKDINSLADLRAAKQELKFQMAIQDKRAKEGLIYSSINKLFHKIEDNSLVQNSLVGSGVSTTLNFLSEKADSKFKLSKTTKTVLSIALMVAVPIITRKLQEYIDDKIEG